MSYIKYNNELYAIRTVAEYNQGRLLSSDILTGKQYRRLRRTGKLPVKAIKTIN
jgi:hypothetical protein